MSVHFTKISDYLSKIELDDPSFDLDNEWAVWIEETYDPDNERIEDREI